MSTHRPPTALLVALHLLASPVGAQATDPAQALLDRAATQFAARDFPGALASLRAVDAHTRAPIVRFNIARCLEEMGRAREAIDAFERYLTLPDEAPRQQRAREAIERLEKTLGTVAVTCTPTDARVTLRGLQPEAPCPVRLHRVPPGTYELAVTHPDHVPHTGRLVVRAGENVQTEVRLQARHGWLVVHSKVPGGEAFLGEGEEQVLVAETPTGEVPLPPKSYLVTVRTPAHQDWTRRVTVAPGQKVELVAEPVARSMAPPVPPPALASAAPVTPPAGVDGGAAAVVPPPEEAVDPLPVVLASGAVAAAVAGTVFYLRAERDLQRVERHDAAYDAARTPAAARAAWADAQAARDDARLDRVLSLATFGAAALLAGAATWALLDAAAGAGGVAASGDGALVGWSGRW